MLRSCGAWAFALVLLASFGCGSDGEDDGDGAGASSGSSTSSSSSTGPGTGSGGETGSGGTGGEAAAGGSATGGGGAGGVPGNQPPEVTITEPAPGATFAVDEEVTLTATVTDREDVSLPDTSIFWEASHGAIIDPIGTGPTKTFVVYEPAAAWTFTVTATDSEGLSTSANVTVQVTE